MKTREPDGKPAHNNNDAVKLHSQSEVSDASGLYDRGKQFVKRREAKLNDMRKKKEASQNEQNNRSVSARRTPRLFDEVDTNERVENRLLNYGKTKEERLNEQRRLKELEEAEKKYSFAPQINKTQSSNPHSDLL